MLSGALWPVHLNPKRNEILSSWIVRNAIANACKIYTFSKFSIPGREIWARDVDKSADSYIVNCLSNKTGKSKKTINQTLLSSYKGIISRQFDSTGFAPGILYLGVHHRRRKRFALQYCSKCLSEDDVPYFRKRWRLSYSVCCTEHGCLLKDRCSFCGMPVSYHRLDYADKVMFTESGLYICSECGGDFRDTNCVFASNWLIKKQSFINDLINKKIQYLNSVTPVTGNDFFAVLRNFMYVSTSSTYAYGFQKEISKRLSVDSRALFKKRPRSVEYMDVSQRVLSVSLAMYLFEDWPDRFVEICDASMKGKSWIMHDAVNVPTWFKSALSNERDVFPRE